MYHLKITLSSFVSAVAADQACDPEVTTGRTEQQTPYAGVKTQGDLGGHLQRRKCVVWGGRYNTLICVVKWSLFWAPIGNILSLKLEYYGL